MKWYIQIMSKETLGACIEEMYVEILDRENEQGPMVATQELRADLSVFLYEYLKKFRADTPMMDVCLYILNDEDLKLISKINFDNHTHLLMYRRKKEKEYRDLHGL